MTPFFSLIQTWFGNQLHQHGALLFPDFINKDLPAATGSGRLLTWERGSGDLVLGNSKPIVTAVESAVNPVIPIIQKDDNNNESNAELDFDWFIYNIISLPTSLVMTGLEWSAVLDFGNDRIHKITNINKNPRPSAHN
jgi:hypothetical protein